VRAAAIVNVGRFLNVRAAYRRSCQKIAEQMAPGLPV
jgi:hypothetical protein